MRHIILFFSFALFCCFSIDKSCVNSKSYNNLHIKYKNINAYKYSKVLDTIFIKNIILSNAGTILNLNSSDTLIISRFTNKKIAKISFNVEILYKDTINNNLFVIYQICPHDSSSISIDRTNQLVVNIIDPLSLTLVYEKYFMNYPVMGTVDCNVIKIRDNRLVNISIESTYGGYSSEDQVFFMFVGGSFEKVLSLENTSKSNDGLEEESSLKYFSYSTELKINLSQDSELPKLIFNKKGTIQKKDINKVVQINNCSIYEYNKSSNVYEMVK